MAESGSKHTKRCRKRTLVLIRQYKPCAHIFHCLFKIRVLFNLLYVLILLQPERQQSAFLKIYFLNAELVLAVKRLFWPCPLVAAVGWSLLVAAVGWSLLVGAVGWFLLVEVVGWSLPLVEVVGWSLLVEAVGWSLPLVGAVGWSLLVGAVGWSLLVDAAVGWSLLVDVVG